jgi:tRNA(His) 5'-end guanylyltransferase
LLAAHATAVFNQLIPTLMKSKIGELPIFDCRVWGVDELEDVLNTFAWREHDARKNAISMMASTYITHKKLQGVSSKQRIEMLAGLGHDFEAMPDRFKYGTYLTRGVELRKLTPDELMKIPQKHREDMKSTLVARSLTKHLYGSIFDPQIKTYIDQRMERFVAHDLSSGSR